MDASNQEIKVTVVTANDLKNSEILLNLPGKIDPKLIQISDEGAYDNHENYELVANQDANSVISPQENAVISQHGNSKLTTKRRDNIIRKLCDLGRKKFEKTK